ncbi:MAG: nitroreductase family protein [Spirochaetia bacterium]|nr:nitroreductase family protein [Spirochaetia bacterium]
MNNMISTIKLRSSWRTYDPKHVEAEKIKQVREFIASDTKSVFGNAVRFQLIDFDATPTDILKTMGTYSVIKDARLFMAGVVEKKTRCLEDYGYLMEKNILFCHSIGLACCWLGAAFDRHGFSEWLGAKEGEIVPAVTPVGYPAAKRRLTDTMMRKVANSDNRKPVEEIYFEDNFDNGVRPQGVMKEIMECVRLAPSATNGQPWRVIRSQVSELKSQVVGPKSQSSDRKSQGSNDQIGGTRDMQPGTMYFYLERTPGYIYAAGQNIDMGIAMAHFELAAAELGLKGEWSVLEPGIDKGGKEYIASCTLKAIN